MMVYIIRSRKGNHVATLKSWNGVVTLTQSPSGHWTWCVGRQIESVLAWCANHFLRWEVTYDEKESV
ncbi:MAG TPA: hypothetical protein VF077_11700 [Nitrospiraceae bacterium]